MHKFYSILMQQPVAAEGEGQGQGPAADSDYASDMGTLFILDLLRQKREKLMRLKKDEMINEMARKQREKMENHRRQQQQARLKIRCFLQNLAVNYFTFTALRSADNFLNK